MVGQRFERGMEKEDWQSFITACKQGLVILRADCEKLERRQRQAWQNGPYSLQPEIDCATGNIQAVVAAILEFQDRAR